MNASKACFIRQHLCTLFLSVSVLSGATSALLGQTVEHLLNLNFGSGSKVGPAALHSGNSAGTNDQWNVIPAATNVAQTYTYYGTTNTVPVVTWGITTNLVWATGSNTTISVTVTNLTALSHNYTDDPMFDSYLGAWLFLVYDYNEELMDYVIIEANPKVVISGLPEGTYDLLVYGLGANYDDNQGYSVKVGTNAPTSTQSTTWFDPLDTNWTENAHYVRFTNLTVAAEQTVIINFSVNYNNYHLINGIQIIDPSSTNTTEQLPAVTFSPGSGTTVPTEVTLSVSNHNDAVIYYSTDNSTPTTNSTQYSSAISLTAATTLKAFATKTGYSPSAVSSATYPLPQLPNVTFSPASGTNLPVEVTLSVSDHTNAVIYYTTDGSTPTTSSTAYSGPVSLSSNAWSYSANVAPTMTSYNTPSGNTVTYSSELSGTSQYAWKAFDHSVASQDQNNWSANGTGPEWVALQFPSTRWVNKYAIQCRTGSGDGPKDWTFEGWDGSQYVTLDTRSNETNWYALERREFVCTNSGSFIKYRLNVSAGNASSINTNACIAVGELELFEAKATITAFATQTNHLDSDITFATYYATATSVPQVAPTPNLTPAEGGFTDDIQVTIDSSLSGASYKYSTNGSGWLDYTNAVTLGQDTIFAAYTTKGGYTDSAIRTNVYVFIVAQTTITPNGGTYTNSVEVTLTNTTSGATIQYSLGSSPLTNYTGPLTLTNTTTLTAVASKTGYTSATNSATFTVYTTNNSLAVLLTTNQLTGLEDVALGITGVTVTNQNAGQNEFQLTLWVTNGVMDIGSPEGVTVIEGANGQTTNLVVTGTLDALNSGLTGLLYLGMPNIYGDDRITFILDDEGNNGTGLPFTATNSISLLIQAVNDPPSFAFSTNRLVIAEDAGELVFTNFLTNISPGPANESGQAVAFTITNVSARCFSVLPAIDSAGTLRFAIATNYAGTFWVNVRAQDDGGTANGGVDADLLRSFQLEITNTLDFPVWQVPTNVQEVLEDETLYFVGDVSLTDLDAGLSTLQMSVVASNGVVTFGSTNDLAFVEGTYGVTTNLTVTGQLHALTGALIGLKYRPSADFHGTDTITLIASDPGAQGAGGPFNATNTIAVSVLPVNDPPSFALATNALAVAEDTGAQTVTNFATAMSPGPANEAGQSVSFLLTTTNAAFFAAGPSLDVNGTLNFTLAANADGTNYVTVQLKDNGGTADGGADTSAAQTFRIEVAGINDPPVILLVTNTLYLQEDSLPLLSGLALDDPDSGPDELLLNLAVTNGVLFLGTTNGLTFAEGTNGVTASLGVQGNLTALNNALTNLAYWGATNFNGQDQLTLAVNDQGHSGSGGALAATNTVVLNIAAVNDPPVFVLSTNAVTADEDFTNTFTVTVTASSVPADEAAQTVTYSLSPASVSFAQISIDPTNGTVTLTSVTNGFGTQVFTVTADDGQAQNNLATATFTLTVNSVNDSPTISLLTPTTNQTFGAPAAIFLSVSTDDLDGEVAQVQFYYDSTNLIATVTNVPFVFTWTNVSTGTYSLTAVATDDGAASTTSSSISVTVATDTDGDGLADSQESGLNTNPNNIDSDGDGVSDFSEVLQGRNPLVAGSVGDLYDLIHLMVYTPLKP